MKKRAFTVNNIAIASAALMVIVAGGFAVMMSDATVFRGAFRGGARGNPNFVCYEHEAGRYCPGQICRYRIPNQRANGSMIPIAERQFASGEPLRCADRVPIGGPCNYTVQCAGNSVCDTNHRCVPD